MKKKAKTRRNPNSGRSKSARPEPASSESLSPEDILASAVAIVRGLLEARRLTERWTPYADYEDVLSDAVLDYLTSNLHLTLWQMRDHSGASPPTRSEVIGRLVGYLMTAARNRMIDYLRMRKSVRTEAIDTFEALPDVDRKLSQVESSVARREQYELMIKLLLSSLPKLSPREKLVIRFYLTEGDSRDCAAMLNTTRSNARQLLSRTLSKIRREWASRFSHFP